MKKLFLSVLLMVVGFAAFAQSKVIQKSSIDDVNIRWIHNTKTNQDYLELCRSPKFDEVVYRFIAEEDTQIEGIIPVLETLHNIAGSIKLNIEDSVKIDNVDSLYSFGTVYILLSSATSNSEVKKYYNTEWCTCLVVYNDFDVMDIAFDDLMDIFDIF